MSFISSLICRWHHYLWSRYRFSRAVSWSRHTFWPGFPNTFLCPLDFYGPVLPVFPGPPLAPCIPFGQVPPLSLFSPFGRARPVIPDFPDFPVVPWDLKDLSFPLVSSCHVCSPFAPGRPGYQGGPAGHTFSLDLQNLVGINCSICVVISFRTSCIVMVRSWSAVRNLSPVSMALRLFLIPLTHLKLREN